MKSLLHQNSSFTRAWTSEAASVFAFQMQLVALGWQLYDLTNSALSLGLIGLTQFVPRLTLVLVVGHVADRYDRRRTFFICQLVNCTMACILMVTSYTHTLSSGLMYGCATIIGIAQSFQTPAIRALMPSLIDRELLPRAIAWSFAARKAAVIFGPAFGGFVYLLSAQVVYATSAVIFFVASVPVLGIHLPRGLPLRQPLHLKSMFDGFAYIRSTPVILGAISMDLFATLLGGATALLPIYARDILFTGPGGLGMLRAAPAVGAVCVSVYMVRFTIKCNVGRVMFGTVAAVGIATIVFGLSKIFVLSLLALVVLGTADMISVVIRSSLVQLGTPDEMRGRVTAVYGLFAGTANELGQVESGITAAWFGTVPAVVVGGVGMVLVVILWMRLFPALLRTQTFTAVAEQSQLARG